MYYARRPRALKSYENCSVSGITGSWNSYAHKILEYDSLRDYSIIPDCNDSFHIDEVCLDITETKKIATDNSRKLPGVINIIVSDPRIIYFPLWTIHLEDDVMSHKIGVCGVTGYTVFEKSCRKADIDLRIGSLEGGHYGKNSLRRVIRDA